MELLNQIVQIVRDVLWDYILLFLLLGTGLFFTVRLKGVQFRKFGEGVKNL